MADPFDALRAPLNPEEPDPDFSSRLRVRLLRAFDLPKGVTVSDLNLEDVARPASRTTARLRHGDVGYASMWVRDGDKAARFFSEVLGWDLQPNDGRWGWAVRGLTLAHGLDPGHADPTLFLCYAVGDIDAALEAVRSAGGSVAETITEPWGPTAMCEDNQGVAFAVYEPPDGVAPAGSPKPPGGGRAGDLEYITMYVGDSASAREFYRRVLGWSWHPGRVEDGWGADDPVPMTGLSGGSDRSFIMPMYRVTDIARAVAQVRALGGRSTDPEQQPYGISAECEDDQGTRFYLGQL